MLDWDLIFNRARALGISKGELASRLGVDYSTLWRYQHGMNPTHPILVRFSEVLGLSIDEMSIGGNPTPPPAPAPPSPPPPPGPRGRRS